MAKLTAQQVTLLANDFLAMSQAVGDYRYQNFDKLTKQQNQQIRDLHWSVLNYADDMYTFSATLVMNDIEASLALLGDVSDNMRKTYKDLKNIQKAIDVAASVVTMGAAILSTNVQAIKDSLEGLIAAWNK